MIMEFPGPDAADLAQVEALNRVFLDFIATEGREVSAPLPPEIRKTLAGSPVPVRARIAKCPFFLFTLSDQDLRRWMPVFDGRPSGDLLDAVARPGPGELRISSAAIALVWLLARQNPYAARFVSGAPDRWCERLAACSLIALFEFAGQTCGLLRLRFGERSAFWRRLLLAGTSSEGEVRRTARVSALQTVLTEPALAAWPAVAAAACAISTPALEVAERASVPKPGSRRYNTPPHECPVDPTTRKNLPER
jgi:hypothetical protein